MAYVSDHAVLRYMDRVLGIDVEAVRREIARAPIDTAAAFGCDTIKHPSGARLKLQGDVVQTVLTKQMARPWRQRA